MFCARARSWGSTTAWRRFDPWLHSRFGLIEAGAEHGSPPLAWAQGVAANAGGNAVTPWWLREERARLSRAASVAKPIDYLLKRWDGFGRKSWLFAGSERGADRAAAVTTLIATAKLNDIDPLAWLADVLARIADIQQGRLSGLLPWGWKPSRVHKAA